MFSFFFFFVCFRSWQKTRCRVILSARRVAKRYQSNYQLKMATLQRTNPNEYDGQLQLSRSKCKLNQLQSKSYFRCNNRSCKCFINEILRNVSTNSAWEDFCCTCVAISNGHLILKSCCSIKNLKSWTNRR